MIQDLARDPVDVRRSSARRGDAAPAPRGWRVVRIAAIAALALDVIGMPIYLQGTSPAERLPAGLALVGFILVRALVAYGAGFRARWAAWVGGALAVLCLGTPFVTVSGPNLEIVENPLTTVLGWAIALAAAAFLVGLVMARRERR